MSLRAFVLNDTRRGSFNRHLGCNAVMENLLRLCSSHRIEVVQSFNHPDPLQAAAFAEGLRSVDAVIVNGEGTMHHDSRTALALARAIVHAKAAGKKTALLNAVWQDNVQANACVPALDAVCARDGISLQQLRAAGAAHAQVAADLSLYRDTDAPQSELSRSNKTAVGAGSALVVDSVDECSALLLRRYATAHRLPYRVMQAWAVREADERHPLAHERYFALADLDSASVLITGRFHAVCFAIKYGRPFLALSSNTHKMEALLQDIGVEPADFLLPTGWEQRPLDFWLRHARTVWARHAEQIAAFAERASASIENTFGELARGLGAEPQARNAVPKRLPFLRPVRVCVFSPWAGHLGAITDSLDRPCPAGFTTQPSSAALRRGFEMNRKLQRYVADLRHDGIGFLPAWVCGPAGLIEFAKEPIAPGEDRWLISIADQAGVLRAQAAKVFGLLVRVGIRHALVLCDATNQSSGIVRELEPHIDVMIRGESDIERTLASAINAAG